MGYKISGEWWQWNTIYGASTRYSFDRLVIEELGFDFREFKVWKFS
jgi:hypothetical protein